MRIVAVETFPVSLPLSKPVEMSTGTIERCDNVLVKITTDEGIVGWGEGVEAPAMTGETQRSIEGGVRFLGERLIGEDPLRRTALWHRMRRMIHGNTTAIGAIDIALHDIAGKAHALPVVELLGGAVRDTVPALSLIGSGDPDADGEAALDRHRSGYRWFKVKVGITDPAIEVKTLRNVLSAVGEGSVVCADANGAWTESEARRFLRELEGMPIRFVEQPVAPGDLDALVRVARSSPVPVCADESAHSLEEIARFGRTGIAGVSLKLIKHGGITGVMRGAVLCDTLGLSINLAGKVAESAVAAIANVHCAAAMQAVDFGCSPANQTLRQDIISTPVTVIDGEFQVPTGPGLGISVDEGLVKELAS